MDFDTLKYRAFAWLNKKLNEAPIGTLLAKGAMPSSVQVMRDLFAGQPLAAFLSYDSFNDEGLFVSTDGPSVKKAVRIYAFGFLLSLAHRLGPDEVAGLAADMDLALPEGYVLQAISSRLGVDGELQSMVCVTAAAGASVADMVALRAIYEAKFADYSITSARITPDDLLGFVAKAFDQKSAKPYDDEHVIAEQCSMVGVDIVPGKVSLVTGEGASFRDFYLYTPRCYGMKGVVPFFAITPSFVNSMQFIAVVNAFKKDGGIKGQFTFAEIQEPGIEPTAAGVFVRAGWLIERDVYNAHLSLLSLFPMGLNGFMAEQYLRLKRWRPFIPSHLRAILPLPFQANAVAAPAQTNVHFLSKEAVSA